MAANSTASTPSMMMAAAVKCLAPLLTGISLTHITDLISGGKYLKFFDIISYPISCHSWRYYIISHILEIFGILYTVKISIFHIYIPHIFISPKMMEILYPVIYPTLGYYIRYRYEKIYIFPTTDFTIWAEMCPSAQSSTFHKIFFVLLWIFLTWIEKKPGYIPR